MAVVDLEVPQRFPNVPAERSSPTPVMIAALRPSRAAATATPAVVRRGTCRRSARPPDRRRFGAGRCQPRCGRTSRPRSVRALVTLRRNRCSSPPCQLWSQVASRNCARPSPRPVGVLVADHRDDQVLRPNPARRLQTLGQLLVCDLLGVRTTLLEDLDHRDTNRPLEAEAAVLDNDCLTGCSVMIWY